MIVFNPAYSPDRKVFVFRGREVLVDNDGKPSGEIPPDGVLLSFEDTLTGCTGIVVGNDTPAPSGTAFMRLPQYFYTHTPEEIREVSRIKGYAGWLDGFRYCPKCGAKLRPYGPENALECPSCGNLVFPRIEPCIIVLITRGKEMLLLRNVRDTQGMYACLAGFVEHGETLEQALRREVREESNLEVDNIRYIRSQSWPFPDQLMMAFYADYKSGELKIQESEIADAGWFTADNLPLLPQKGSVARGLIDNFLENNE